MSNRVSDAIGVGMGHAVMAAASTISEALVGLLKRCVKPMAQQTHSSAVALPP
jgi:hypothetical protein